MPDSRFFTNAGALSLGRIAELTGAVLAANGAAKPDPACKMVDVAPLDTATAQHISFLDNIKYIDNFTTSKAGACFVRPKFVGRAPESMALLVTEIPYFA